MKVSKILSFLAPLCFATSAFAEFDVPPSYYDFYKTRAELKISSSELNKNISGYSSITPWSGSWFPFRTNKMVKGVLDDHARYLNKDDRDYKLTPFEKYALYLKQLKRKGVNIPFEPEDVISWEITNHTFEYDDMPKRPNIVTVFDWRGHCDGLAAAAILFDEPIYPITKEGITFTPGDQKAILTELSKVVNIIAVGTKVVKDSENDNPPQVGVSADFTMLEFAESHNTKFENLLATLDAVKGLNNTKEKNSIDRLNEYLTITNLFEIFSSQSKLYLSTETKKLEAATRDLRNQPFTSLTEKSQYLIKNFNRALLRDKFGELVPEKIIHGPYEDVDPADFHSALIHYIKNEKVPFGMDFEPGEKVHNHPVYEFVTQVSPTKYKNKFSVNTEIKFANYESEDSLGTKTGTRSYKYDLYTDDNGKVVGGEWTGLSINNHPDMIWAPYKITDNDEFAEFSADYEDKKFFDGKTPEKLLEKLSSLNLKLKIPSTDVDGNSISEYPASDQLNAILLAPNLYDELMRIFPDMKKSNEMKVLEDETDIARAFTNDPLNIQNNDERKIKKLNRLAIDSLYPKESPKRKFPLVKNPYIMNIFVKDLFKYDERKSVIAPPSSQDMFRKIIDSGF